jgi:hypothetical protein
MGNTVYGDGLVVLVEWPESREKSIWWVKQAVKKGTPLVGLKQSAS